MFGIGFFELCVIAVVALVFVGPKKLPDLMRQVGKFFVQVRRMTTDVKGTMDEVIRDAEQEIQREELAKIRELLPKSSDITGDPAQPAARKPLSSQTAQESKESPPTASQSPSSGNHEYHDEGPTAPNNPDASVSHQPQARPGSPVTPGFETPKESEKKNQN